MEQCNLVELFSGIGSQAKALKNLGINVNTLGTSEWDIHAIAAYDMIHTTGEIPDGIQAMDKEELLKILKGYTFSNSGKVALDYTSLRTYSKEALQRLYTSITRNKNFVDISTLDGAKMPDNIDILTYSFPCQDLSNVGAFHGYNKGIDKGSGSRSSLLWQVGRILTEMKYAGIKLPRYLLMENVPTLLSKRHIGNFNTWIDDLRQLGYISKFFPLNATSFGLPQNRPRLLMISVFSGNNQSVEDLVKFYFDKKGPDDVVSDYRSSAFFHQYTVQELLRTNYDNPKILDEAIECTPNDTASRRKIWEDNPQIVLSGYKFNTSIDAVRTITTKQDRNPNSGNLYFDSGIEGRSKYRYLTPRECLLFMGFTDEDYRRLKNNNVEFHKGDAIFARDKIIRMAGNSIPVKLLEGIFLQILQIDRLLDHYMAVTSPVEYDIREKRCFELRSFLFSRGIRCRMDKDNCPLQADVVYSKYKTAVYICDDCKSADKGLNFPVDLFREYFELCHECKEGAAQKAINAGWNLLFISQSVLENKSMDTLARIEQTIHANYQTQDGKGRVYHFG